MQNSGVSPSARKGFAVAADTVLVFHTLFALFAIVGGFLVLWNPWWLVIHLPVAGWSALVNLAGWICPLTPLEKTLRQQAGQTAFEGGWLQHHLEPILRPLGMPRRMELIAGASVVGWNLLVYGVIYGLLYNSL